MLAWLDLKPSADDGRRNRSIYGGALRLPEVPEDYSYLVSMFEEFGCCVFNESYQPIPYTEIEAWARPYRMDLQPWEIRLLRTMSMGFCGISNNPKSSCPLDDKMSQEQIQQAHINQWLSIAIEG